MAFVTSTDQHPVLFGSDGLPLPVGSFIRYCEQGTTTLKTIYADSAHSSPTSNPMDVGSDSRTNYQVFLGEGAYTAYAYKYVGDGSDFTGNQDYPPDAKWELDNQWDEYGESATPTPGDDPIVVETVEDLRLLGPLDASNITLLGYWAAGDKPVRSYHWQAGYLGPDDLGYVIRNPLDATGAWICEPDSVVDVRDYGVIGDDAGVAVASHINSASAYALSKGMTLYFPKQTIPVAQTVGSLAFQCAVHFDAYADFEVTGANPLDQLYMYFQGAFSSNGTNSLRASTSSADLHVQWQSTTTEPIDPRWAGLTYGDAGVDDLYLNRFFLYGVTPSHPILIAGQVHFFSIPYDFEIRNRLIFQGDGYLRNWTSYRVTLNDLDIRNQNTNSGYQPIIVSGGNAMFVFKNPMKTSYFYADSYNGITQDLGEILTNIKAPEIIYDAPSNVFTTVPSVGPSYKRKHTVYGTGGSTVRITNNHATDYVWLEGEFEGTDNCLIGLFRLDVVVKSRWFLNGLDESAKCAWYSSQTLDLCGKSLQAGAKISLPSDAAIQFRVTNGKITTTEGGYPLFEVAGSVNLMELDCYINNSGHDIVSVLAGVTIDDLSFRSASYVGDTVLSNAGTVNRVQWLGCNTYCNYLYYGTGTVLQANITSCPQVLLQYARFPDFCKVNMTGSNFYWQSQAASIEIYGKANTTGCYFAGTTVKYHSYGGYLIANHTGNTHFFETGANAKVGFITQDEEARTEIVASNNNFTHADDFIGSETCIYNDVKSVSSTWYPSRLQHKIDISGNKAQYSGGAYKLAVKQTKGSIDTTVSADGSDVVGVGISNMFYLSSDNGDPMIRVNYASFHWDSQGGAVTPPTQQIRNINSTISQATAKITWKMDGNVTAGSHPALVNFDLN